MDPASLNTYVMNNGSTCRVKRLRYRAKHVDINYIGTRGWTAVMYLIFWVNPPAVKVLIELGADTVHIRNMDGMNAGDLAVHIHAQCVSRVFKKRAKEIVDLIRT